MKKKIAALALCSLCVVYCLCAAGFAQAETGATAAAVSQEAETGDYLTTISGTYVELFPELAKEEYRSIWVDATTPLVGSENTEAVTDMLLGMCMAEPYGAEATEKYTADPDSMAFNCYFLGGVSKFIVDGHTITGLDDQGQTVFFHQYRLLDVENENGFIFYQSEDADAGEFTYFAFSRTPCRPPITWNSAMPRTSAICKAGLRAATPTGMPLPLPRITTWKPWKMSFPCLPPKIWPTPNKFPCASAGWRQRRTLLYKGKW